MNRGMTLENFLPRLVRGISWAKDDSGPLPPRGRAFRILEIYAQDLPQYSPSDGKRHGIERSFNFCP